jgi:Rrf2 family nitric oxide-sensitive transcriptional repressor
MYCGSQQDRDVTSTISEIAEFHKISRSHSMKVVMELSAHGWLYTTRGRGGGIRLLMPAEEISIGEVIKKMEDNFTMVECFSEEGNSCQIDGRCKLKHVLSQALDAYMKVLDGVTLKDLVVNSASIGPLTMMFNKNK